MEEELRRDIDSLRRTAARVLERCSVRKTVVIDGKARELSLHVPSGDFKYPSFWVRDAAMMAESGFIPSGELEDWLFLICGAGQNGPESISLKNGLRVPAWSVADHINFDGRPVFFPGTYSSGEDQGDGSFGFYPPHDDQYSFIRIAYLLFSMTGRTAFLLSAQGRLSLLERLLRAFDSGSIDEKSGLCVSDERAYTVDWGFCDQVKKSGLLLFPSLLRFQAASNLAEMLSALNQGAAVSYSETARRLKASIVSHFSDGSGWLLSATGWCRQRDVWGTAFALWLDILGGEKKKRSVAALADAYREAKAVHRGYVRHILPSEDPSSDSAWERTICPYGTYQNGGYWAAPTGWYLYALSQQDTDLAERFLRDFIRHTEEHEAEGAPFEWRSPDDSLREGSWYGASAGLPYQAAVRVFFG